MTDHPTAPVQDDDAEWLRRTFASRPHSFTDDQRDRLERIASRLSPGLVEALRKIAELQPTQTANYLANYRRDIARAALSNVLPASEE